MSQRTVLLIEDQPEDREMYGSILWYNGYDVLYAEDGEAGLAMAQKSSPDLVILDLGLPLLHGSELMSRLKQEDATKSIPVIALTGKPLHELGGNSRVLGYARYLEKPVSPLELLRIVEQIIGRPDIDQRSEPHRPQVVRTEKPMSERERIAQQLQHDCADIVASWEVLVREEPWFSLPRANRVNNLGDVVDAIAGAALVAPDNHDSARSLVILASQHGQNRRSQGIPETLIPVEFHLLRRALWHYLHDTFQPNNDTYDALMAIDRIVSLALNASMWGYYREEIEGQAEWEAAIDRLINDAVETEG